VIFAYKERGWEELGLAKGVLTKVRRMMFIGKKEEIS
jgi:hypothetical protein